jgi:hypothetical protein
VKDEAELADEARRSRDETRRLREESGLDPDADAEPEPQPPDETSEQDAPGNGPWAKTSSGDADSITDDD